MNKYERSELVMKGITVLRPQYEERKKCWKIAKANYRGGWTHFGTGWYVTQVDADTKINEIVARDPVRYCKDI